MLPSAAASWIARLLLCEEDKALEDCCVDDFDEAAERLEEDEEEEEELGFWDEVVSGFPSDPLSGSDCRGESIDPPFE
jgi:hypothetical protein